MTRVGMPAGGEVDLVEAAAFRQLGQLMVVVDVPSCALLDLTDHQAAADVRPSRRSGSITALGSSGVFRVGACPVVQTAPSGRVSELTPIVGYMNRPVSSDSPIFRCCPADSSAGKRCNSLA